ncbi:polysaccharide deacetylase family protein [candidate division KSB1 bacterium]|nr:polysaccharide deacetylase family protein [candidate division KSB1 bacterium]
MHFLKKAIKIIFSFCIYYLRLDALLYRCIKKSGTTVLLYHSVNPSTIVPNAVGLCISPKRFERHIRYLAKRCNIIPISEMVACLENNKPLPANSVAITLDDGFGDNFKYAFPILKKYRSSALIFLISDIINTSRLPWLLEFYQRMRFAGAKHLSIDLAKAVPAANDVFGTEREIDLPLVTSGQRCKATLELRKILKKLPEVPRQQLLSAIYEKITLDQNSVQSDNFRMLSWDEIRSMRQHGIEFGAHSRNHANLLKFSEADLWDELIISKQRIEENLKEAVTTFAFPGYASTNKSPEVDALLKRAGYRGCMSDVNLVDGINGSTTNPFDIRRIEILEPTFMLAGELVYYRFFRDYIKK